MAKAVVMPKAGITVESCIIGRWKKKPGDRVSVGDILFDYETDKASFECESTEEGVLLECFWGDGDEVPVLVNICAVGEPGEDVSALRPNGAAHTDKSSAVPAPVTEPTEATSVTHPTTGEMAGSQSDTQPGTQPGAQFTSQIDKQPAADGVLRISPRARAYAARNGVEPTAATPTGVHGRIVEADVRRLIKDGPAVRAVAAADGSPEAWSADVGEYDDVRFSGIRRAISKSMKSSLSSGAQLTNHHSFDATSIQRARAEFKAAGGELGGVTIGDMVLFAVSRTLLNHPDLNAVMLDDNTIRHYHSVNLAVAIDTPRGLMVPVIRDAEKKSLTEISREVKQLAEEARGGSINPDKLKGGSFTVSNLGALGVESFTPVINAPQTGILGVCSIVPRPRKSGDGYEFYPAMGLSLTYDHRAVDGGPAARFVRELCANLEGFTALLLK